MNLERVMSTKVVTIEPSATARAAQRRMRRERIRHLVVVDDDRIDGVVSAGDLLVPGSSMVRGEVVEELMAPLDDGAAPDMTLADAAAMMKETGVGCLPVLDDGRLVGVVTATDVFDELGREIAARGPRPRVEAARGRRRRPGSTRRAPFAGRQPRPVKRRAGRTAAPEVPANIRVQGVSLEPTDRDYVRRKLGMKLGKFADSIERVSVRVEDVNGPRGGVDQVCRVKVVLAGLPSAMYEARHADLHAAIDTALTGAERVVRQALRRRRMKPLTPRSYGERASAALRS